MSIPAFGTGKDRDEYPPALTFELDIPAALLDT